MLKRIKFVPNRTFPNFKVNEFYHLMSKKKIKIHVMIPGLESQHVRIISQAREINT